jgi:TorA maturation chaperone TorD
MGTASKGRARRGKAADRSWGPVDEARLQLYRCFSLCLSDPRSERWTHLQDPAFLDASAAAAAFLCNDPAAHQPTLAPGELRPDDLCELPVIGWLSASRDELAAEHDRVFGLVSSKECPPYETDYCPQTFSVYRSQQIADVAGFYRAFGLAPSRDMPERHDHAALELEFMAWLLAKERHARTPGGLRAPERAAVCRDVQRSFFEQHLAWWLPAFALALRRKADGLPHGADPRSEPRSLLGALGCMLASFVAAERAVLGVPPPTELVGPRPAVPPPEDGGCASCGAESGPAAG